jgi:hypothetical protein
MKKKLQSPQVIITGIIILICAIIFAVNPNSYAQEKPKTDSIQVYQFIVTPQGFKTGTQIIQDKFLKNGTVSDTVLLQSAMNMLFSNGKAVKILNPEKEVKKNVSPLKK